MIARSVIENIASALTENYKVRVFFRGSDCFTDGKTIVLPSLPDTLPGKLVELIRGYLDHEVAHILFSDFKIVETAVKEGKKSKKPLHFVMNAVEDVRIERCMAKVYKGCGINFEKSRIRTMEKLEETWKKTPIDEVDPIFRLMVFFIFICQVGWEDEFITKHAADLMPLLEHLAPEMEATADLVDSKGAYELAKIILEKIETFTMPEMPEMSVKVKVKVKGKTGSAGGTKVKVKSKGDKKEGDDTTAPPIPGAPTAADSDEPSDSDDPSDDSSETIEIDEDDIEIEDETDGDESEEESSPAAAGDDSDSDGKGEKEEGAGGDADDDDEAAAEDPLKELREKVKKSLESKEERTLPSEGEDISKEAKKVTGYRPFSTEKDTFTPHSKAKIERYNRDAEALNGVVTTLRGRMSRILLSQKRSRWDGNKRKGILNPSQLHQVVSKTSESVYRVRKDGIKMNTAISILIDLSGSMGERKTRIARQTTILLAETLTRINTPFEILGFSGDLDASKMPTKDRSLFARWGSLDMFYFTTFDENYGREQKERIAGMQAHAENYDGESVMFAAKRLQARPELKKILFVLSDGAPAASACDYGALRPHLTKVVHDLEKDPRLTVVGFGMLTDAPKKFYRHHVLVDNLEKFPEVLMSNLYKQLV